MRELVTPCEKQLTVIPHICQFWYTAILSFTPKSAEIRDKVANIIQNGPIFCVLYTKKYTSLRKVHRTAVVTNMSYVTVVNSLA